MKKFFRPDYSFDSIFDITPEFLMNLQIKALVADLDNTIADYDTPMPTPEIISWFGKLHNAGIKISIVSNNGRARVEKFCENLGVIEWYWKSGKPASKTILRAIDTLGCAKENVAMLGDKISTDVLGARFSGIVMIKVKSIKPRWKRSIKK